MEWQEKGAFTGRRRPLSGGAGLDRSLRWWVKETSDGSLLLQRSVFVRYSALAVAVVGSIGIVLAGISLLDPSIGGSGVKDVLRIMATLSIPFMWSLNVLCRRTVIDERGIEMQRLVFTERRPWESVLPRFSLSLIEGSGGHGGPERARICLVNGDYDDVVRLPGSVLGMRRAPLRETGQAAIDALLECIAERGWGVPNTVVSSRNPALVGARRNHGAEKLAQKTSLVFFTPVWRRLKEHLCNGGLFLVGSGVLALVVGLQQLFFEVAPVGGSHRVFAITCLFLGPALMAYPIYKICGCFQRVVVDSHGIRAGGNVCSWPESRSCLFISGDRIFVVYPGGHYFALDGAGVAWGGFQRRQKQLVARCEAIWLWGVMRGFTHDSGRYIPVRNEDMQREREIFERGVGLAVPR